MLPPIGRYVVVLVSFGAVVDVYGSEPVGYVVLLASFDA